MLLLIVALTLLLGLLIGYRLGHARGSADYEDLFMDYQALKHLLD